MQNRGSLATIGRLTSARPRWSGARIFRVDLSDVEHFTQATITARNRICSVVKDDCFDCCFGQTFATDHPEVPYGGNRLQPQSHYSIERSRGATPLRYRGWRFLPPIPVAGFHVARPMNTRQACNCGEDNPECFYPDTGYNWQRRCKKCLKNYWNAYYGEHRREIAAQRKKKYREKIGRPVKEYRRWR